MLPTPFARHIDVLRGGNAVEIVAIMLRHMALCALRERAMGMSDATGD
jgi:hypothetical protein